MNNEAIKQKTNELAELLRNSDEHRIYLDAKTRAYGNESTRRLLVFIQQTALSLIHI